MHKRLLSFIGPLLLTGCGTTASVTSTRTHIAMQTSAATATPTPTSPHLATLVWQVMIGSTQQVRAVPVSGGSARVLTTIPGDATVLAAGAGKLAVQYVNHSLHIIDVNTDSSIADNANSADALLGGAFNPDGSRFAYVSATTTPSSGKLEVMDVASGAVMTLRTFPKNTYDVPQVWAVDAIAGEEMLGFSDAPVTTLVRLNPATGMRISSSDVGSGPISPDGVHAAASVHRSLGDDADSQGGPGAPQPYNTLRSVAIGSAPVDLLQEPHHQILPWALSSNGDTICYSDDPATAGFAGASMSSSLGLFFRKGDTTTQLLHWDGSRWDGGVFVDGRTVAVANHTSTAEKLLLITAGSSPLALDAVSRGQFLTFLGIA